MRKSDFNDVIKLSSELFEKYAEPDFPVSYASAYYGLENLYNNIGYLRVMTENGEVVGWMAANEGSHQMHSYIKGYNQLYYHTSLRGVKAVRALIAFHEDFFKYAEKCHAHIAITSSSLPNASTFYTILQHNGWNISGNRCVRRTRHYPEQTQPSPSDYLSRVEAGRQPRVEVRVTAPQPQERLIGRLDSGILRDLKQRY
jgi:hypothetical protein